MHAQSADTENTHLARAGCVRQARRERVGGDKKDQSPRSFLCWRRISHSIQLLARRQINLFGGGGDFFFFPPNFWEGVSQWMQKSRLVTSMEMKRSGGVGVGGSTLRAASSLVYLGVFWCSHPRRQPASVCPSVRLLVQCFNGGAAGLCLPRASPCGPFGGALPSPPARVPLPQTTHVGGLEPRRKRGGGGGGSGGGAQMLNFGK